MQIGCTFLAYIEIFDFDVHILRWTKNDANECTNIHGGLKTRPPDAIV